MSSLSLPRVLQPRKTSLELERETFEKFQSASIGKAVNSQENPVKEKHVRNAILGTFHDKSSTIFWQCSSRLPLMENVIVAWKFCHVLHKILREGHPHVIRESIKQAQVITNVGKMWFHLKDGYGKLIYQYTRLLLGKLDFHRRNPGFPGNLILSQAELDRIGDNDINNYFQMSVEMFDYLDEILALQAAVFGSLDMSRSNSMTSSGQCRLSPLIPCIQDSSQLYDFCVKILFKLHASLPSEILAGHRSRFLKQFSQLRQFYMTASTLQYFKHLIHVPTLPETPPNLLIQAELGSYVTPVVILPDPPSSESLDSMPPTPATSNTGEQLVDLSHTSSNDSRESPDLLGQRESLIEQRDALIEQLQAELSAQKRLVSEQYKIISELRETVNSLELRLATMDSELSQEKQIRDDLLRHTEAASLYHETEKKLKGVEEKFTKLKDVYTKLREEHIALIRQKADVDKQLASVKNIDLEVDHRSKLEEELSTLQTTAEAATEQNEALVAKMDWICKEKSVIEGEVQDILAQKNDLDVRLRSLEDQIKTEKAIAKSTLLQRCKRLVEQTLEQIDSHKLSSLTCTPEYLNHIKDCLLDSLKDMPGDVVTCVHHTVLYMILGKATSNTAPDIDYGERMSDTCKAAGKELLSLLTSLQVDAPIDLASFKDLVTEIASLSQSIKSGDNPEAIGDLVENELAMMDKAIEEAAIRIEEMLKQSRQADTGVKLEVNEKILDSCTTLMKAIRILVQKSRLLQAEIIMAHHGSASNTKEFYKRNHQWTEGLISAAKAVAMSAKYLLTAADQVVTGGEGAKLERLIVASHGVAASTAQLVVASRVKADRHSAHLAALSQASRDVTNATGSVVATAKTCIHLVDESADDLDIASLSLHQARRLEMEAQVRVLELEAGLEKERLKLSALRRHHYQLTGDEDNS